MLFFPPPSAFDDSYAGCWSSAKLGKEEKREHSLGNCHNLTAVTALHLLLLSDEDLQKLVEEHGLIPWTFFENVSVEMLWRRKCCVFVVYLFVAVGGYLPLPSKGRRMWKELNCWLHVAVLCDLQENRSCLPPVLYLRDSLELDCSGTPMRPASMLVWLSDILTACLPTSSAICMHWVTKKNLHLLQHCSVSWLRGLRNSTSTSFNRGKFPCQVGWTHRLWCQD